MSTDALIAFKGELIFDGAFEDDEWGKTVRFIIPQATADIGKANPFKRFTKARKGRVGTRFEATIVKIFDGDHEIIYCDNVMLKGWTDGTGGWKVTFWIASDDHPFMTNYTRGESSFAIAMVELDDDETAINQGKRDRLEKAGTGRKRKPQRLSQVAAIMCANPRFWEFASSFGRPVENKDQADAWLKQRINILSKRELDDEINVDQIRRFHDMVRKPLNKFIMEHYGDEH